MTLELLKSELAAAKTAADMDNIKSKFLGKKSELRIAMDSMKTMDANAKKLMGQELNTLREAMEYAIETAKSELSLKIINTQIADDNFDMTLPGKGITPGALNPLTIIENKCLDVMRRLGFELVTGPDIETADNCFDILDIPKHHPARDLQDTFWIKDGEILPRTHTTSVQSRFMLSLKGDESKLPIRIVSPGKVYRNEAVDATHLAIFHQFEGLYVGKDVKLSELKGIWTHIIHEIYGADKKIRFKPKYYPYTEPSIGADILTPNGKWVTVGGAGMVSPAVLRNFGFDPARISGLAFGFGTTRMASEYAGADPREVYGMDLRVLKNIKRGE
jgi:phenylalanyl-tRNA synthetase alpha chain